jgi:hypothetical protein
LVWVQWIGCDGGAFVGKVDIPIIDEVTQFLSAYSLFRRSRRLCVISRMNMGYIETDTFYNKQVSDHRDAAIKLSNQTPFQSWISKNSYFKNSLSTLLKSKISAFLVDDEEKELLKDIYSFDDEITWRLQYIYGCGIYAYNYPERMEEDLSAINLSKKRVFSNKTKKSAKRLLNNLQSDQMPIPQELNECLTQIIMEADFGPFAYDIPDVSVNGTQRRRYTIYQICSISTKNEFMPTNSKKGRFYPNIIMDILSLLGEENLDIRTIQLIMEPFDLASIAKLDEEKQNILEKGAFTYSYWADIEMFKEQLKFFNMKKAPEN